jgi:hypothetical protein
MIIVHSEIDNDNYALSIESEWGEVVSSIIDEAFKRFVACDSANDFGFQGISSGRVLVFGSVNRVLWSASQGFYYDELYCTERFKRRWSELY